MLICVQVIKWPGQEESSGESKVSLTISVSIQKLTMEQIPTKIAYRKGKAYVFGAEVQDDMLDEETQVISWFKVRHSM
jgi:hypothetical protein